MRLTLYISMMATLLMCGLAHAADAPQASHPIVPGFERFYATGELDDAALADGGELLLAELNCVACHAVDDATRARLNAKPAPDLTNVGTRLDRTAIRDMMLAPHTLKAGTTMPAMFAGDDGPKRIGMIVSFLASLSGAGADGERASSSAPSPGGSAERGRTVYHTVGCVACHDADRGTGDRAEALPTSVPIALAGRYDVSALAAFLRDPLAARPAGRMPATHLTAQEAADVAAYLHQRLENDTGEGPPHLGRMPAHVIAEGQRQFTERGCAACHTVTINGRRLASTRTAPSLATLQPEQRAGCMNAEATDGVPHYGLNDRQRAALTAAIVRLRDDNIKPLTLAQRVDRTMTQLNCYACHKRGDKGGVEAERAAYYTVTEPKAEALGPEGKLPPVLTMVGRKLTREALGAVLAGKADRVRPYMGVRMPAFGAAATAHLVDDFDKADVWDHPIQIDTSGGLRHQRERYGRSLIGVEGLNCVTCHGIKGKASLGVPAPDLTYVTHRLQPEYFKAMLLNPQALRPGTMMPPLFTGRKNADIEIEQLWTYLKEADQRPLPTGLLDRGTYELKPDATSGPIVFRTFMEGPKGEALTRAIAVGMPSKTHAAFDATRGAWVMAWRGAFIDAMGTWDDRFAPLAKPLGDDVRALPVGPTLARLTSGDAKWPGAWADRDVYRFGGYRVGKDGGVTMLYTVDGLSVEDTLHAASDGHGLRRTVKLSARGGEDAARDWWFRGYGHTAEPRRVSLTDGVETIEEVITW
ncbi:MAG: c-type cytochrome [Phycisphaera sp.]|nr:c-type cytochrome [Phycisphaera sp.]